MIYVCPEKDIECGDHAANWCNACPRAGAAPSAGPVAGEDEETYQLGKRDGFDDAVQAIDLLTGGDGEYRYCTDGDPDRHTPDAGTMMERIAERFATLRAQLAERDKQLVTQRKWTADWHHAADTLAVFLELHAGLGAKEFVREAAEKIEALREKHAASEARVGVLESMQHRKVEYVRGRQKGDGHTYRPAAGEMCLISGPNCDNEDGYVFFECRVLWKNDIFVLYGKEGCWPNLNKWDHVIAKPMPNSAALSQPSKGDA